MLIQRKRFWNKRYPFCLGNISEDVSANNMKKKTGLNRCVYVFLVHYKTFDTRDIIDIHKKHNMK